MEAVASQKSIAIHSLPDDLSQTKLVRGKSIFGFVGDEIDKIAVQYQDMYWWISKDGLNMAVVPPAVAKLSPFDDLAGRLYVSKSKDGRLSKNTLKEIAKHIDAAAFSLRELQPAQRRPLIQHNQKYSKQAIKTFEHACRHRVTVRAIRKRLYLARERFIRAHRLVLPPRIAS